MRCVQTAAFQRGRLLRQRAGSLRANGECPSDGMHCSAASRLSAVGPGLNSGVAGPRLPPRSAGVHRKTATDSSVGASAASSRPRSDRSGCRPFQERNDQHGAGGAFNPVSGAIAKCWALAARGEVDQPAKPRAPLPATGKPDELHRGTTCSSAAVPATGLRFWRARPPLECRSGASRSRSLLRLGFPMGPRGRRCGNRRQ